MARPSDLLRRFRLMAVPGRAGVAGVPVDRAALLREELAPVFAALRDTEQRANEIVKQATMQGNSRRTEATLEAQRILDGAREAQPTERASAANAVRIQAESSGTELLATASAEVERINRVANQKMAPLVNEIVGRVLSTGLSSGTSP